MKKFRVITAIFALFIGFNCCKNSAGATQLPDPVIGFIKSEFPGAGIRFDGLVELPDHTTYLPVMPLVYGNSEKPAAVVKTIPANTSFSKKPDMILFANNLALLKIIKVDNKHLTVNYSPEIPLSVKLGILPQDLIVPQGLELPTELRVIMGDLKIAVKPKKDEDDLVFFGEPVKNNEKKVSLIIGKVGKQVNIQKKIAVPELDFIKNMKALVAKDEKVVEVQTKELLDCQEMLQVFRFSKSTLNRRIAEGMPAIKVGAKVMFNRQKINDWLNALP